MNVKRHCKILQSYIQETKRQSTDKAKKELEIQVQAKKKPENKLMIEDRNLLKVCGELTSFHYIYLILCKEHDYVKFQIDNKLIDQLLQTDEEELVRNVAYQSMKIHSSAIFQ